MTPDQIATAWRALDDDERQWRERLNAHTGGNLDGFALGALERIERRQALIFAAAANARETAGQTLRAVVVGAAAFLIFSAWQHYFG